MTKYKFGYKVLSKDCSSAIHVSVVEASCTPWYITKVAKLKYEGFGWTEPLPGCGPLCVFLDYKHASHFAVDCGGHKKLFLCLYEPSDETEAWDYSSRKNADTMPSGKALAKKVLLLFRLPKNL